MRSTEILPFIVYKPWPRFLASTLYSTEETPRLVAEALACVPSSNEKQHDPKDFSQSRICSSFPKHRRRELALPQKTDI